jgi:predicted nucleic acid-binding protein
VIVVDANVIAYLVIPGKFTEVAERLLETDPQWVAPRLWRSEVRNVLATYVRNALLGLADATVFVRTRFAHHWG